MKYLFLLLLCLPAHGQEKQSITNLIFWDFTPDASLNSVEFNKLRTPVPDMKTYSRLVRVQDNFRWLMRHYKFHQSGSGDYTTNFSVWYMNRYFEVYLDPKTMEYYQAPFFYPLTNTEGIIMPPLPKTAFTNKERFVYITNLQPHIKVYADTANNNFLFGQYLSKIPDLYKGYIGLGRYLYPDPKNKYRVILTPITNQNTGDVCYTGTHPITKQIFYVARDVLYSGGLSDELSDGAWLTGGLFGFSDTIEEVWDRITYLIKNHT